MRRFMGAIYGGGDVGKVDFRGCREIFEEGKRWDELDEEEFVSFITSGRGRIMYEWWERLCPIIFKRPNGRFAELEARYDPEAAVPQMQRRYGIDVERVHSIKRRHWSIMEEGNKAIGKGGKNNGNDKHYKFDAEVWQSATKDFFLPEFSSMIFKSRARTVKGIWTIKDFMEFGCRSLRAGREDAFRLR